MGLHCCGSRHNITGTDLRWKRPRLYRFSGLWLWHFHAFVWDSADFSLQHVHRKFYSVPMLANLLPQQIIKITWAKQTNKQTLSLSHSEIIYKDRRISLKSHLGFPYQLPWAIINYLLLGWLSFRTKALCTRWSFQLTLTKAEVETDRRFRLKK